MMDAEHDHVSNSVVEGDVAGLPKLRCSIAPATVEMYKVLLGRKPHLCFQAEGCPTVLLRSKDSELAPF